MGEESNWGEERQYLCVTWHVFSHVCTLQPESNLKGVWYICPDFDSRRKLLEPPHKLFRVFEDEFHVIFAVQMKNCQKKQKNKWHFQENEFSFNLRLSRLFMTKQLTCNWKANCSLDCLSMLKWNVFTSRVFSLRSAVRLPGLLKEECELGLSVSSQLSSFSK